MIAGDMQVFSVVYDLIDLCGCGLVSKWHAYRTNKQTVSRTHRGQEKRVNEGSDELEAW